MQKLKKETLSREFVAWRYFLEEEINSFDPLHYYLAQVSQEIRRVLHKHPKRVKLKHFLIKFENSVDKKINTLTKEEATKQSQKFWFGVLGLNKGKK